MKTIKNLMEAQMVTSWEELATKFPDHVGLCFEMEEANYRYIAPFAWPSLMSGNGDDFFVVVYSANHVRIDSNKDTINGNKVKSITPISKKDLTDDELYNIFSDTANVFDDTEKFQKFYGLMGETEDKTEPPYFIQKENLMMKIGHLEEELAEIKKAAENNDIVEFADGIIDLIYVASGLGNLCRLPMHQLWNDVQNSNMVGKVRVKSLDDATKRGSTFDVKKGPSWVGPRGADIIKKSAEIRERCKNQG